VSATRTSALALASSVVVSAGLIGAAFFTVQHAGCDSPGHLAAGEDGVVQLVGGCVSAEDLVVPGAPASPATVPAAPGSGLRR
jgi:hypothetical protein